MLVTKYQFLLNIPVGHENLRNFSWKGIKNKNTPSKMIPLCWTFFMYFTTTGNVIIIWFILKNEYELFCCWCQNILAMYLKLVLRMHCTVCHLYHTFGAYSIIFLNCSYTFSFSNESIAKCRYFFNSMKNNKTDESIRKHRNNNYWFDIKPKPIQDNNPFLFSSTY